MNTNHLIKSCVYLDFDFHDVVKLTFLVIDRVILIILQHISSEGTILYQYPGGKVDQKGNITDYSLHFTYPVFLWKNSEQLIQGDWQTERMRQRCF